MVGINTFNQGHNRLCKQQDKLFIKVAIKVADHFLLHDLKGIEGREILLVSAHRSEGIVDISKGADVSVRVNTGLGESIGVAGAVFPFMMLHGNYLTFSGEVTCSL